MLFLNHAPELNQRDLDIYTYIVSHMDQVIYMRIRDLAKNTHTSTATILRFCKKFGCEGFSEFKIKLQLYQKSLTQEAISYKIDNSAFMNFIHRVSESVFQERIKEATELLVKKNLFIFVGEGSSKIIAEYGVQRFSAISNLVFQSESLSGPSVEILNPELAKKVCIIVISASGETAAVIDYLNQFIINNCPIISITNSSNSTVARLSDVNLAYYITTEQHGEPFFTSQVPAVYILEYLAKEVRSYKMEYPL